MPKSFPDSPRTLSPPLIRFQPAGPVTTEYRVGLCAWQDKSMVQDGRFYPIKSMKPEERLWWYSRFFDCVEVDSTFYAVPSPAAIDHWSKRVPPVHPRTFTSAATGPSSLSIRATVPRTSFSRV